MRSERNGSSGKQSCCSGRARSCGGYMQRKRHGGARSCGSGGEEVVVAAVKKLRQWSCSTGGERCADNGGARICVSCGGTGSFTVVLLHQKVDLRRKEI
ncbi:unnamed protein product, partial [Brassica oleracea]